MRCRYCGSRKFRITIEAYQSIEYNDKDEIVFADTTDFGDMIEERGYYCCGCERELKTDEVVMEKQKDRVITAFSFSK